MVDGYSHGLDVEIAIEVVDLDFAASMVFLAVNIALAAARARILCNEELKILEK